MKYLNVINHKLLVKFLNNKCIGPLLDFTGAKMLETLQTVSDAHFFNPGNHKFNLYASAPLQTG